MMYFYCFFLHHVKNLVLGFNFWPLTYHLYRINKGNWKHSHELTALQTRITILVVLNDISHHEVNCEHEYKLIGS